MAQEIIEPPNAASRRGSSWWRTPPDGEEPMDLNVANQSSLNRFLGGSPLAVFVRLLFVSLIVGAFLMWLDIRPIDVIYSVERLFRRIWNLGFDAVREIFEYIIAGAVLVVPIWLVIRLMNMRSAR